MLPLGVSGQSVLTADHTIVLVDPSVVDATDCCGQPGRKQESDRHCLTMGQLMITHRLDGVAEGVAVVEEGSTSTFALVGGDDVGFDANAPRDAFLEGKGKQVIARNEVILRDLPETTAHLSLGKSCESVEIFENRSGLPKGAHEILSLRKVHCCLTTHRGIDHPEQGGRDIHERCTTMPTRRRESGDIGDHASTDRDDRIISSETEVGESSCDVLDGRERFR